MWAINLINLIGTQSSSAIVEDSKGANANTKYKPRASTSSTCQSITVEMGLNVGSLLYPDRLFGHQRL